MKLHTPSLKFIGRKEMLLRSLYSLCLALNRPSIHLINISNQQWTLVVIYSISIDTPSGSSHLSGYCSPLLFPKRNGVRHRFLNKIHSFDSMINSSEKHWRTCKRGALPN